MLFVKKSVLLLVLVSVLIVAACAGGEQIEQLPEPGEGDQLPDDSTGGDLAAGSQLVGSDIIGDWNLVSLNGHDLVEGSTITASFDGQQITGSACNSYFGGYTAEVDSISFSGIGSTEMFCPDTMDQEQEYFAALAEVNSWSVEAATLTLSGDSVSLVFERSVPPSDVAMEGTDWALESFIIGGDAVSSLMADTAISATITDGLITGNATCNDYGAPVTIDGAAFSVGEIEATEQDCEVGMEQEAQYFQTLSEVTTWRIEGNTLTLSAESGSGLVFRAQ